MWKKWKQKEKFVFAFIFFISNFFILVETEMVRKISCFQQVFDSLSLVFTHALCIFSRMSSDSIKIFAKLMQISVQISENLLILLFEMNSSFLYSKQNQLSNRMFLYREVYQPIKTKNRNKHFFLFKLVQVFCQ